MKLARWGGASRFGVAAFAADFTFYLTYTAVPLKAIALGGGPIILGLLPALSSSVYIVSALLFGNLARSGRRMKMARLGVILLILGALLLRLAPRVAFLFAFLPIVPLGAALFWPAIQAELGHRGASSSLGRRIGWFNVSWSFGKMVGFLAAGHLAESLGPAAPLGLAVLMGGCLLLLTPWDQENRRDTDEVADEADGADSETRRRHRLAAWAANLVAYGSMGTLIYQFPKKVLSLGMKEGDLGNFLALVQLTQTLTFICLGAIRGWQYRRVSLILPLALGAASIAALALWRGEGWFFACAPGIGIALGFAYSSSLYHSLHREPDSGRFTGIHEAVLGSGGFVLPLLGGAMASAVGLNAPYLLCSAAFVIAIAISFWLLSRVRSLQRPSGSHQLEG